MGTEQGLDMGPRQGWMRRTSSVLLSILIPFPACFHHHPSRNQAPVMRAAINTAGSTDDLHCGKYFLSRPGAPNRWRGGWSPGQGLESFFPYLATDSAFPASHDHHFHTLAWLTISQSCLPILQALPPTVGSSALPSYIFCCREHSCSIPLVGFGCGTAFTKPP